jgi:hypothetical protein
MRTSGAHHDTVLYAIPLVVLVVVAVSRLGGLQHTLMLVNETVLSAVRWLTSLV